jgi:hypothetical protein
MNYKGGRRMNEPRVDFIAARLTVTATLPEDVSSNTANRQMLSRSVGRIIEHALTLSNQLCAYSFLRGNLFFDSFFIVKVIFEQRRCSTQVYHQAPCASERQNESTIL